MKANSISVPYILNDELRREVIIRMLALIKESYVFSEVADKVDQIIQVKLNNREYAEILDPYEFSLIITKDLQDISKDKHLGLKYSCKANRTK